MKFVRRIWPTVVFIVLLGAGAALWWQRDVVLDWAWTRQYTPSPEVAQLASDTDMTSYARRLFYVNHPQIEDKQAFNQHCERASQEIAVLGCFRGNRSGIYIYNVTDDRLAGIKQVTAAHEMLHQAYARLSGDERNHIDGLLNAYASTITDQALKDKIASYQKTEPNDVTNELHSILGTEVTSLPPELETYYKRYFIDRAKVVAYHAQYQAAFDERTREIADYDKRLATLRPQIDVAKAALQQQEAELTREQNQLAAYKNANQVSEYNAAVPSYNALVYLYRAKVEATNQLIAQYNQLVEQRNALAVQEQELQRALDSSAAQQK